jgi:hypothetical protein
MSKIIKLKESDLEKIIRRVITEQGLGDRVKTNVKAKVAGAKAGAETRRTQNREKRDERRNEREIARQLSVLESLNNSFIQQINRQKQFVDRQLTNKGLNDSLKGVVETYKTYLTNLGNTLESHVENAKDPNKRNQNDIAKN